MLNRTSFMQHAALAAREEASDDAKSLFMGLMRLNTYPSCRSASSKLVDSADENLSIETFDFDAFLGLPSQFVDQWIEAVYELNPSWAPDAVVPQRRPSKEPESSKSD
jgi:hypothetical protein